jgi:ligand-binding sensor domain-containing protein
MDKDNVLWVGTENGVARYVNGTFQTFSEVDGLANNSCWNISQDHGGSMWFASYGGGISKFDGKRFTVFTKKQGLLANKCRKVFPYKNKVYVGTEAGVSIIDINTNKVTTPQQTTTQEVFIAIDLFVYQGTVYFITTLDGIFKIDESGAFPKVIPVYKNLGNFATCLLNNQLYLSHEGSIATGNIADFLTNKKGLSTFGTSIVNQFLNVPDFGLFAVADGFYTPDGGLFQINGKEMQWLGNKYQVDSRKIYGLAFDPSKKTLYVGSNDKGVYEIQMQTPIHFYSTQNKKSISIESLKQNKYVLQENGVLILNAKNEPIRFIANSDFKKQELAYLNKKPHLRKPDFRKSNEFELNFDIPAEKIVFYDMKVEKSSLWIATNIGIFEMDRAGKLNHYIPKHSMEIGFTPQGKFIQTVPYSGVNLFDDVYQSNYRVFSRFDSITPQFIVGIQKEKQKTYLISVFNGLFSYEKDKFRSYLVDKTWKEKRFKHITSNAKGQLIVSAEFGDVYILEDKNKFRVMEKIDRKNLVGKSINFLQTYQDVLLIGTERGVNVYKDGRFRLIDKEQGLSDCNFSSAKVIEKNLWLGTATGYYIVDLKQLLSTVPQVSKMTVADLQINGKPLPAEEFKWFAFEKKKINCDYQSNTFLIELESFGHPYPHKLRYRYRLNTNDSWSPYNEKPSLFLSYLPSGDYALEVEVLDLHSGKTKVFSVLNLSINPPFWQRWPFVLFMMLLLTDAVLYFVNRDKEKAKAKATVEKRLEETRLHALLNQMNPHFVFNALNTIQYAVCFEDPIKSSKYISDFASLMRMILNNSSKQYISLEKEIQFLKLYVSLENLRFGQVITITWHVAPEIDVYEVEVPPMLIQPFVENVFVHAFSSTSTNAQLNISFEIQDSVLLCTIADNGVGKASFDKKKTHQSKALELTKERLKLMQPEIENAIEVDFSETGTTAKIRFLVKGEE